MAPKGLKKVPTGPPRPPKVTKLAKVEPRMALDGPRAPWENAKISQGSFMVAPRRGQEGPRWRQGGFTIACDLHYTRLTSIDIQKVPINKHLSYIPCFFVR